jgi:hypothetical protein
MQVLVIILKSYFAFLTVSLLVFGLGFLLRRTVNYSTQFNFKSVFFSFLLGLYTLIFFFSIYYTNFKTVFILLPLVILPFTKIQQKTEKKTGSNLISKNTLFFYLLTLHIVCFIICVPMLLDLSGQVRDIYVDYHFYVRIIDFLKITGQENEYHGLNLLSEAFYNPKPYHFAEIWTILLSDKLTSLGVLRSIFLITLPLYIFMTLVGILGYFQEKIQQNTILKLFLIVFISINCGGIYFIFYENFNVISDYEAYIFSLLKNPPSIKKALLVPLLISFLLVKPLSQKFSLLALIAISSFGLLPAILGTIILEFVFLLSKERNLTRVKSLLYPIFICLSILLFYTIFKNDSGIERKGLGMIAVLEQISHLLTHYPSFFSSLKNFIGTLLRHGIFFFPFFVYWLVVKPKTLFFFFKENNGRAAFSLLLAGAFTLAIFRTVLNSPQLVYNITMPFWGILTAILTIDILLELIENKKFLLVILGLSLFTPSFLNKITTFPDSSPLRETKDTQYLENISQWANEQKEPILIGGSLKNNQRDYASSYDKYVTIYTLGYDFAQFIDKPFLTVSLNDLSIPISQDSLTREHDIVAVNQGAFYNFAQEKKAKGFLDEETLLVAFIKEKKLTFIISRKGNIIPQKVLDMVEKKYIDKKTGEQFLILKHE